MTSSRSGSRRSHQFHLSIPILTYATASASSQTVKKPNKKMGESKKSDMVITDDALALADLGGA